MAKAVSKTTKKESYDVVRASKAPGRMRRARYALQIAATLAAVDGPLPFGDVLAAGLLIGGGWYLIYSGAKDVIQ